MHEIHTWFKGCQLNLERMEQSPNISGSAVPRSEKGISYFMSVILLATAN